MHSCKYLGDGRGRYSELAGNFCQRKAEILPKFMGQFHSQLRNLPPPASPLQLYTINPLFQTTFLNQFPNSVPNTNRRNRMPNPGLGFLQDPLHEIVNPPNPPIPQGQIPSPFPSPNSRPSSTMRRFSMPRMIAWWSVPGSSSLASLGIIPPPKRSAIFLTITIQLNQERPPGALEGGGPHRKTLRPGIESSLPTDPWLQTRRNSPGLSHGARPEISLFLPPPPRRPAHQ